MEQSIIVPRFLET